MAFEGTPRKRDRPAPGSAPRTLVCHSPRVCALSVHHPLFLHVLEGSRLEFERQQAFTPHFCHRWLWLQETCRHPQSARHRTSSKDIACPCLHDTVSLAKASHVSATLHLPGTHLMSARSKCSGKVSHALRLDHDTFDPAHLIAQIQHSTVAKKMDNENKNNSQSN